MIPVVRRLATVSVVAVLATACGDDSDSGPAPTEPVATSTADRATTTSRSTPIPTPAAPPILPWPSDPRAGDGVARWTLEVVDRIPHDLNAFTQGLEVHEGVGFEGTGRRRQSTLRRFDPVTGAELDRVDLDDALFGEGITVVDDTIVQLTLESGLVLRWDLATLDPLEPFTYAGLGWGLCAASDRLVMTDGSADVQFRDPDSFALEGTVEVTLDDQRLARLNELDCLDGLVVANVWLQTRLVVFDPDDGTVLAEIDASSLRDEVAGDLVDSDTDVLNGVADLGDGTMLLAGKNWPVTFRVRLVDG